jgi:Bacterial capsule synthesis protein PGA_cap
VAGHHPHSLQGIEVYQNKPICHSLGNFLFDYYFDCDPSAVARNAPYVIECDPDRAWSESAILEVTLSPGAPPRYELWPVLLDARGNPQLLRDKAAQAVIERLAALSAPLGGRLAWSEGRGTFNL